MEKLTKSKNTRYFFVNKKKVKNSTLNYIKNRILFLFYEFFYGLHYMRST
jgi:hypothetical protein